MQLTVKSCNILATNVFFFLLCFLDGIKGSCCATWDKKF